MTLAEAAKATPERRPTRRIWFRILACALAVVMLLSLFMLDAVRIKLGRDAETKTEMAGAEALAENSEYLDASTPERMAQWLRSVLSSPETFEDYYQIAMILIAQGEYARALPNIDASILRYTGNEQSVIDELYMKQGSLHAMLGEYEAMEQSFMHVSEESGYHAQKLLLISQAAIERNDVHKAIAYLERYLALRPEDTDMLLALGQLCVATEDYERAAAAYGDAIALGADTGGSLHFLRGSCHMEIQEYALALSDFLAARAAGYQDMALCLAQCALCSFLCGEYENCLLYGEEALMGTSELVSRPDLCYYMGLAAMALERYDAALGLFGQAAAQESSRQDATYYEAICLMALDRQEEAVERFTALIEEGYSPSLCHYNRAASYIAMRAYALAKADLEKVVALNDDEELTATARELLGQFRG